MAVYSRWQTYYWVCFGLGLFGLFLLAFFHRETRFERPAAYTDGQFIIVDAFGNLKAVDNATDVDVSSVPEPSHGLEAGGSEERLSLWQKYTPFPSLVKNPVREYVTYWKSTVLALCDPAVLWAMGLQTVLLACIIVESLSLPTLLEQKYHWAHQNTGLFSIAGVLGPAFAVPFGALADKVSVRLANRAHGRHKPEHRFLMMAPPALVGILFVFLYGHLAEKAGGSWAGLVVCYGAAYFTFVALVVSTTSFTVEHFSHNPGPALVLVLGGKNILSYPISNGLAPLITQGRFMYVHTILGGILVGWAGLAIPLYFALPYLRNLRAGKA